MADEPSVLWRPNKGPQEYFLGCTAKEVLFGGSAGGGKSDALLIRACRYALPPPPGAKNPWDPSQNRAIILRRTFPMLSDLIRRAFELYLPLCNMDQRCYNKTGHIWTFPSGGTVRFGYCESYEDVLQYQGQAFSCICWDELTQMPGNQVDDKTKMLVSMEYLYMFSRLRTRADSNIPLQSVATCNPGGVGHRWVQIRWGIPADGCPDGQPLTTKCTQLGHRRVFIPARVKDNPHLGKEYLDNLEMLPEAAKIALKHGRWDSFEGNAFPDFKPLLHTAPKALVPLSWVRWRGGDDGYSEPTSIHWFARDPRTGIIYVYQELYTSGVVADKLAHRVMETDVEGVCDDEDRKRMIPGYTLTGIYDSAAWGDTGIGNSQGNGRAQIMNNLGCRWEKCSKGPGSRIARVNSLHQYLIIDPATPEWPNGKPRLVIMNSCKNLIESIPLLVHCKNNPEDIEQIEDHAFDSLTYGLQKSFVGGTGNVRIKGI